MARLIDIEEDSLLKTVTDGHLSAKALWRRILRQPTVDAEPIRHGRWIEVDVGDCCYKCSECGFIRDGYLLDISNYCPNCGAKMEKERCQN